MEKTLYLSENRRMRVRADGPSLWVEQPGQAGRRVPVRLVRRVVIVGNVALDTESLTQFAERGVPVTLLNRQGEPVASLLGVHDGDQQRRARQASLLENRENRERVLAWLSAWERGRQLALASCVDPNRAREWRRHGFRPADYEAWVLGRAQGSGLPGSARSFFRGAMYELVAAGVTAQGWDPHLGVRHRTQPLGFVKDCAGALSAEADRLWLAVPRSVVAPCRRSPMAHWVSRFEAYRLRIEALVSRLLDQYAVLLWEV